MRHSTAISLDDYEDAQWLEDGRCGRFSRYQIGVEPTGEGITEWFCTDCLMPVEDIDDGCSACGLGTADDEEEV